MVMPERCVGIDAQRSLKLLDSLHRAVRVLVSPAQQHVGQSMRGLELDGFLQLLGRWRVLILLEQHQRQIKVNVEMTAFQGFRTSQSRPAPLRSGRP